MAAKNLKAMSTELFCRMCVMVRGLSDRLNGLLYTSIGYFFVEDAMQRGTLLYSDSTHVSVSVWCEAQMQSLFNNQLQVLVEALQYHLRIVSSVDDLMAIEVEESEWSEG